MTLHDVQRASFSSIRLRMRKLHAFSRSLSMLGIREDRS